MPRPALGEKTPTRPAMTLKGLLLSELLQR